MQAVSRTLNTENAPTATNDDMLASIFEMENEAIGTMQASRVTVGHPLTGYIEIDGDEGSIRIGRTTINDFVFRDKNGVMSQTAIHPAEPFSSLWSSSTVQGAHPFSWHDCFAFQAAEMLQIARGDTLDTVWSASIHNALRASEVAEAMIVASKTQNKINVAQI